MILARKFTPAAENDYERLAASSGRLRAVLEAFVEDRLPGEYGPAQLAAYGASLLEQQRPDGSFASYAKLEELDDDVRTDAHRFVSWCALAFLSLLEERHPNAWTGDEPLKDIVDRGLNAAVVSDFSFPESGPAELVQQIEAVLVLASGGIFERLASPEEHAPALRSALADMSADFHRRLDSGDTHLTGGVDYRPLIEQAAAVLSVLQ